MTALRAVLDRWREGGLGSFRAARHAKLEKRLAAEVGARHGASLRRAHSALIDCAERDGVRVRLRPM